MKTIETMLAEKNIQMHQDLDVNGHIGLTVEMLIDFIRNCPSRDINAVEKMLRKLDFLNRDIMDYLNHLGFGMVKSLGY